MADIESVMRWYKESGIPWRDFAQLQREIENVAWRDEAEAQTNTNAPARGTTLHCGCCGLPWATVTPDGVLVVESRHGGRVHENRLSVAALAALTVPVADPGAPNGETWGYNG